MSRSSGHECALTQRAVWSRRAVLVAGLAVAGWNGRAAHHQDHQPRAFQRSRGRGASQDPPPPSSSGRERRRACLSGRPRRAGNRSLIAGSSECSFPTFASWSSPGSTTCWIRQPQQERREARVLASHPDHAAEHGYRSRWCRTGPRHSVHARTPERQAPRHQGRGNGLGDRRGRVSRTRTGPGTSRG